MLKNKKFLLGLLLLLLVGMLAACGGEDAEPLEEGDVDEAGEIEDEAAEEPVDEEVAVDGVAAEGAAVFENNCMMCHGSEGVGASAPSLVESDVAAEYEQVVEIVATGRPEEGMPAFADQLSEDEIQDVAAYVSELATE